MKALHRPSHRMHMEVQQVRRILILQKRDGLSSKKKKARLACYSVYYKIGFNRAARIMDQLADAGVVGPEDGTKPRKVLMTPEEFETVFKTKYINAINL